jgi:putative IMPACT (imprinted ancient) family translation regulator
MSLDAFIISSKGSRPPAATAIASSQEIRDRSSRFVAHLFRARGLDDARAAQQTAARLHTSAARPTHAMYAWRAMALRAGRTGLAGEEDFVLQEGREDDGEKWGGERILRVMKEEGVLDAAIVVLRWYACLLFGVVCARV